MQHSLGKGIAQAVPTLRLSNKLISTQYNERLLPVMTPAYDKQQHSHYSLRPTPRQIIC